MHAGVPVAGNRHRELLIEAEVCVHRDCAAPRAVEYAERLFGKPVYVCPSFPNPMASPALSNQLVFGDLSHYVVHASTMLLRRITERFPDFYEAAYMGLLMVDAVVFDPTNGVTPPIISAEIQ